MFQWAAIGNIKVLELAKRKGWNLNKDMKTYTLKPIHLAVQEGKGEVVSFLLYNGVNINEKDKYENSPLHHACTWSNSNC